MTELSVRAAGPASVVTYRVGGREYPMKTVPSCKVCKSPHRFEIEEQIVAGRTYQRIVDALPEDTDLNYRNVGDHYRSGHMPLEMAATRQIVEQRAHRVGKRIEDSQEALVDGVALMEVVVQKTFEEIARGALTPDLTDGLRAAKMLADLGEYDEGGGVDQNAVFEAFMVYHENAKSMMSPEQFEEFGRALDSSPVLKALAARFDGEDVVDAEIVEEPDTPVLSGPLDSDGEG